MPNSVERFSSRVENYDRYRPGYPPAIIDFLASACQLTPDSIVADIGSGTGKLTELFLENGNRVFAIEPNIGMREKAEHRFRDYPGFSSIAASAEATTLAPNSTDFIASGQAFHWFDQERARTEFQRILRGEGWVVLVWNERQLDSTPFLQDYENLLLKYGTDYKCVRHERVENDLHSFFAPEVFQTAKFANLQVFDLEGLTGRVLSSSYSPEPGHADYPAMIEELERLFETHQVGGRVTIEYDTNLFFGRLRAPTR